MFETKTDIRTVCMKASNLWAWTVMVNVTEGDWAPRTFEVTGFGTTLEGAQAEMMWAVRLTEMKLTLRGLTPAR